MKTFFAAFIATVVAAGAFAPALAGESDSRSYNDRLVDAWITTGDDTYGRLSGLTDAQIKKAHEMPFEHQSLTR